MLGLFSGCQKLKEIRGLNRFDTKRVINMSVMFSYCTKLEYLDLSNFNTSNVTNMSGMFNRCQKLKNIPFIYITFEVSKLDKFNEDKEEHL